MPPQTAGGWLGIGGLEDVGCWLLEKVFQEGFLEGLRSEVSGALSTRRWGARLPHALQRRSPT